MKKILLVFVVLCCVILGVFFYKNSEPTPETTLPTVPLNVAPSVTNPVIEKYNSRISSFNNLQSKASFTYYDKIINITLKGWVYLEKPKNFRIIINSFFGNKAIDIGSNFELFWFWSKWMDKLNSAYHKDYEKTRLKDPLNPMWLMESFGLSPLDSSKVEVRELDKQWAVSESVKSQFGYMLKKTCFINKITYRLEGYALTDENGKILATSEVKEYFGELPKKILFNWKTENLTLMVDLTKPVVNHQINSNFWKMPDITPKEEMR